MSRDLPGMGNNGVEENRSITVTTAPQLKPATARKIRLWGMAVMVILLAAVVLSKTYTMVANSARAGRHLPMWEPVIWESTSAILIALLVPAVGWWLTQFPVIASNWLRNFPAQLLATLPFSLVHVAGMVALRVLAYQLLGQHYEFGRWWPNWLYEYRKDFITYWVIVLGITAFRMYGLWLDSCSDTTEPLAEATTTEKPPERLIVRKLNREYILNVCDIDRIDANGNYVTVHAQGAAYPRRESLVALEKKLDQTRFVRVHRGHIVNVDRIREIQPWDHGDYRIVLHDGSCVNLSRRYRGRLQHLFR